MNLIPCAEHCRYQQEGYCHLPVSTREIHPQSISAVRCIYYTPLSSQNTDRLTDLRDR